MAERQAALADAAESVSAFVPCAAAALPSASPSAVLASAVAAVAATSDIGPGDRFTLGAVHPANLAYANPCVPGVASGATDTAAPDRARRTEAEPLTAELTRLHVTVSRRLLEKLAAAREALSHSHPRASDDEILELGLDLIVERHRKRRGIGAKPRKSAEEVAPPSAAPACAAPRTAAPGSAATSASPGFRSPPRAPTAAIADVLMTTAGTALHIAPAPPPSPSPSAAPPAAPATGRVPLPPPPPLTRRPGVPRPHVPAAIWRAVWEREGGRCVWPVDGGGVCGSTRRLQLDHVDGWALGADTTPDACRLLCATYNDLHARALYGPDLMNRYSRPKGPRCSEPVATWTRTPIARPGVAPGAALG